MPKKRRAHRVRRGVQGAAHGTVGVSGCHHQRGIVARQPRGLERLLLGHSLGAPPLVEGFCVRTQLGAGCGVEKLGGFQRDPQGLQTGIDLVHVPQQCHVGQLILFDQASGFQRAVLLALKKNDVLGKSPGARAQPSQEFP